MTKLILAALVAMVFVGCLDARGAEDVFSASDAGMETDTDVDGDEEAHPEFDPECGEDFDYVVRNIWPRTYESYRVDVDLGKRGSYTDVKLIEFELHACRAVNLAGMFFWFSPFGVFHEEEESDLFDPEGIVVSEKWVTRFHDFNVWEGGQIRYHEDLMAEMTVADTNGSAQFHDSKVRRVEAGEQVNFVFTASVRPENPPDQPYQFTVGLDEEGGLTFDGPPTPNPRNRRNPWGLTIAYPTLIRITPPS